MGIGHPGRRIFMQDIKFSFAKAKDIKLVGQLLSDCGLPYQDVATTSLISY